MKTITTFFFALGLLLSSLLTSAQSKSDKIYDSFADEDGVTSFTFTKNMVDAFNIDFGDDEEKKVTGDLNKIRFMSYNPEKGNISGKKFLSQAISMLPSQYKRYEDDDEDDSNAEIWLLGNKKNYSECHVFVSNENPEGNCFVVSFYGDFKVNDLDLLKKTGKEMSR